MRTIGSSFATESPERELDRIRIALRASGDLIYDWDLATDTLRWWGDVAGLLGTDDIVQVTTVESLRAMIHPDDILLRDQRIDDVLRMRAPMSFAYRLRTFNGETWVEECVDAECTSSGRPARLIGSLRPITRRKEEEARLRYLASHDELTGVFNRERLRDGLAAAIDRALRHDTPCAYLVAGIDNLAVLNQNYGFDIADAVIAGVVERLKDGIRSSDVIGRIAGKKFGIVLAGCNETGARIVAAKLLGAVRDVVVETAGTSVSATISIGCVTVPDTARSVQAAMINAEEALDAAKRAGRDCYVFYRMAEGRELVRRRNNAIAEGVVSALRDNRVRLAFQPIVEARTGTVAQHECLMRIIEPDGTTLPASAFIPVIEKLGLVRFVDRRTLDTAFEILRSYPEARIAINVSGLTSTDAAWLETIVEKVRTSREVAARLTVEMTETVAIRDLQETARFVRTIRDLGCKVALDDFGDGYISFRHLRSLGVDLVKIDGSFIREIVENEENQSFVRTLLELAGRLGIETIAESVESAAAADLLVEYGVGYLQGYHFGAPSLVSPWGKSEIAVRDGETVNAPALDGAPAPLPGDEMIIRREG